MQVKQWIVKMKEEAKAFYTGNCYLLAGALLQKYNSPMQEQSDEDLTDQLLSVLTSLH